MIQNREFTITDPRNFDGNPMQVAGRAMRQAEGITEILVKYMDAAERMALNAELERQQILGLGMDAPGWPDSPQGRLVKAVRDDLEKSRKNLQRLAKIAGTDPS